MLANRLKKMAKDWFLFGMISAVILATLYPDFGRSGGTMRADVASDVGIFLVFLFHGIGLSTESMKKGLMNWRLHLTVQTMTFVMFPVLWFGFRAAFSSVIPDDLMLGFLYLCALPSTISSSVAMTAIGKGNVPAAIFNATLSSLLGIFLTPVIISLALATSGGQSLSLIDAMIKIAILLLLPFAVGQGLRPLVGKWFSRYKKYINNFDKAVILMLVYASFCDSVKGGLWTNYGLGTIGMTMAGAALILVVVLCITTFTAHRLGFNKADEVTAVFCGSKKTLASGVPMAKLLFGAHPALGVIVLPIMFYHQIQLFGCSILAERYARRVEEAHAEPASTPEPVSVQEPVGA
jgi:solute carrier family 10 (sodium/bile acid cotransporter), member 7